MSGDVLTVYEQADQAGDIVYAVALTTYSRATVARLRDLWPDARYAFVPDGHVPTPDSDDLDRPTYSAAEALAWTDALPTAATAIAAELLDRARG